jgi:hypothetical protein
MPIRHAVWKVGSKPTSLVEVSLGKESLLEEMICADLSILSDGWLLIGRQVKTSHGGIIDVLALNADAQLVIVELKRDQTPREVVAQAIDYASWAEDLAPEKIVEIFHNFSKGKSLDEAFLERFGIELDEEQLDGSHQIVVVASTLDASTERIVQYLSDRDVSINAMLFQVFQSGEDQLLSRSWLLDPIEAEAKATSRAGPKGDWNGEFYVSYGHGMGRDWSDARQFGFISAGGGAWYTRTLSLLKPGDRVWVKAPDYGYVGVGLVTGDPISSKEFFVTINGVKRHIFDVTKATYHREVADDEKKAEYFVPVEWIETRSLADAVSEVGMFGNQNTVCRPRTLKWNETVDRLRKYFTKVNS